MKILVERNAGRVLRIFVLFVSASCLTVEAGKGLASQAIKQVKFVGHPAHYFVNAGNSSIQVF